MLREEVEEGAGPHHGSNRGHFEHLGLCLQGKWETKDLYRIRLMHMICVL